MTHGTAFDGRHPEKEALPVPVPETPQDSGDDAPECLQRLAAWRLHEWAAGIALTGGAFAIEAFAPVFCRPVDWSDASINNAFTADTFPDYSLIVVVALVFAVLAVVVLVAPQCKAGGEGSVRQLRFAEVNSVLLYLLHALAFAFIITNPLKVFDGRLRPDFLSRLRSLGYTPNTTGVDYCALTHTSSLVHTGRLSFPSGHATTAFFVMTALSLYFMSRLRAWSTRCVFRFLVGASPMVLAFVVASTRTRDNRHHHADILAGAVAGAAAALLSWRLHFVCSDRVESKLRLRKLVKDTDSSPLLPWFADDECRALLGDHVPRSFVIG